MTLNVGFAYMEEQVWFFKVIQVICEVSGIHMYRVVLINFSYKMLLNELNLCKIIIHFNKENIPIQWKII